MTTIRSSAGIAVTAFAQASQRVPQLLFDARRAMLACCVLASAGCSMATPLEMDSAPKEPAPTGEVAAPTGPPAVAPPRLAPAHRADRASWSRHSKAGREQLALRNYREAEDEFVIAMQLAKGYGPVTQRQRTSLANLERVAQQYHSRPEDLIRITRVILPIAADLYGPSSIEVAEHSSALGGALIATGQFEDARKPLERAMAIFSSTKSESREVSELLLQLGIVDREAGDLTAAETHLRRALEIGEEIGGPDNPELIPILSEHARVLSASGLMAEAEAELLRATRIAATQEAQIEARTLNELAWFYTESGRPAEAEALGLRAVELVTKRRVPATEIAAILDTLGVALLHQGKYEEAEIHLARAYGLGPTLTTQPFDSVRAHYAQVLRAMGRESEASTIEAGGALAVASPAPPQPKPSDSEPNGIEPAESELEAVATVGEAQD